MRKLLMIAALCVAAMMNAQTTTTAKRMNKVRPIEFEMHAGVATALDRMPCGNSSSGPALGIELRYNIKNSPLDIGLAIDFTHVFYEFKREAEALEQDNMTTLLGFTADYNFHQGGNVNPFAGIGLGLGIHDALIDVLDDTNDCNNTAMITPRAGVELWRHLRFTLAANLSCRYFNNVSLTVGCVLGRGKKKD